MRVLITGVTGFVGSHLARALLARGGVELFGLARQTDRPVEATELDQRVRLFGCDLCDGEAIERILREVQPDHIYHLAGYSDAGRSYQEPDAAWQGNLAATRSLYDAVMRWGVRPRILYVGSGAVYGEPEKPESPVDERSVLRPNSPYAASKAAADLASYQYVCAHGLDIVRTRPFNHVGPGQSARFAVANFARQIAAMEKGLQAPVLRTGNLWTQRDLTDVRDVVHAYLLVMEHGVTGDVYNIASGQTLPMQTFLDRLLTLSRVRVRIETAPELIRKVETAAVRVDTSLIHRVTGWTLKYSLDQMLADTLDYWRGHT